MPCNEAPDTGAVDSRPQSRLGEAELIAELMEVANALVGAVTVADVSDSIARLGAAHLHAARGAVVALRDGGLRVTGTFPAGPEIAVGDDLGGDVRAAMAAARAPGRRDVVMRPVDPMPSLRVAVGFCDGDASPGAIVFDLVDAIDLDRARESYLRGLTGLGERALARAALFDRLATSLRTRLSSRNQFRALLDAVGLGILVVDAHTMRVAYANREARELLGGRAQRIGRPLVDPWPEFSLRGFAQSLTGTGGPRWLSVALGDGRLVELDGIARHGRTVIVLREVTRMEREAHESREFVMTASHELRSPVDAISHAVDALRLGAAEEPGLRGRFLDGIASETDRLSSLTHALLMLVRTHDARPDEVRRFRLLVRPLLERTVERVASRPEVSVDLDCADDIAVLGDRALLECAVFNLVENAARHTERGRIVVSGRYAPHGRVQISVADTGRGIAPEAQPRVFEPFVRDCASTGFGIGLPLARRIARSLGGDVVLTSRPGVGTTVTMTLGSDN